VGQQIFAVGNPYGLEASVTRGIVSAKGRQAASDESIEYIQHDAAVNQGNSGGPLLNLRGEVVGINSAIFTRTGGWQGISFAMPSNSVRRVLDMVVKYGRVIRGYLGVVMQDINEEHARNFHLPDRDGAIISGVVPGSPADQAGLRPGDVVRTFNRKPVKNFQQLRRLIAATDVGQEAEVGFIREGKTTSVKPKISEMPAQTLGVVPKP
jgi:serine protease Do